MSPAAGRRRTSLAPNYRQARLVLLSGAAIALGTLAVYQKAVARGVLGLVAMGMFALVAAKDRKTALTLVVIWLIMLGFVRRFLIPFVGWNEQDPLLLVSPACAVVLWYLGSRGRRPPARSALWALGVLLFLWAIAEIVNPEQGSLLVNAQAALQWVTPWFWFFAGRTLQSDEHEQVLKTVFWMGIVVTGHGLYQTFFGLLPFEYTWLDASGQGAAILLPGFRIRPFSTLVSPQEYGFFMSFLAAIIWARILHGNGKKWLLIPFFLIASVAMFLQGTRTVLVLFLVWMITIIVLRLRTLGPRLVAVGVLALLILAVRPPEVEPPSGVPEGGGRPSVASHLTLHQLSGLTSPENSTAPLHARLIVNGFRASFSNPFGLGIGSTSLAAFKAGTQRLSPENDIAAVFAVLGPVGGILFVAFIIIGLFVGLRTYLRHRTWMHLAWVGMLVASFTQWWAGLLYAVSALLFLTLGGLSRIDSAQNGGGRRS